MRRAMSMAAMKPNASRLLDGARPLLQPRALRPDVVDMLTGKKVEAHHDALGVELPNVDLTQTFTDDELESLHQACDDSGGIVVFTNQKESMTIHDHVAFARQMADYTNTVLEPHAVAAGHPEAPEVLEIIREPDAAVTFGENWHSDNCFHDEPSSFSILRGVVVPRLGVNDTLFSSSEDAFDALSQTMQNLLLDLNAYQSANKAYGDGHAQNSRAAMKNTTTMRVRDGDLPILDADVLHPIVTVHPRTGRKALYASPTFTSHIDGMHPDESAYILNFVYKQIAKPEFCTRVSWQPNQVVMWDNRSTSHKGLADDLSELRVVQRVSIRGTAPVNHRGVAFSGRKTKPAAAGLFE